MVPRRGEKTTMRSDSNTASFSSVLAYVEHTYGNLPALSSADQNAYAYAQSFNYSQAPLPPVQATTTSIPRSSIRYLAKHPEAPDTT